MAVYVLYRNKRFLIDPAQPVWQHREPFKWWLLPHGLAGGTMGREAALTFAREGALVVGCDLHADDAEATVQAVRAAGGTMVPCIRAI